MPRCTLSAIARAADVGVSTVSYALRGDPKIPKATADRVREVARKLGYRADPAIAHLMAHIRAARRPTELGDLAFVWIEADKAESRKGFNKETIEGAQARAVELGFRLHEFWLSSTGMTSQRLGSILKARGIVGVIFSGCERETAVQLQMDWGFHSTAIVGNAPWTPELHRACHNHHLSAKRAMLELASRGYRRPAAVLNASINERTSRSWEGAFLAYHPRPEEARGYLRFADILEDGAAFQAWFSQMKPDAIVISHPSAQARILKLLPRRAAVPGFVALDLLGTREKVSGILVRHSQVAANAVDLVIAQMHRNETGVPEEPHRVLIVGQWFDGSTLK